jgi:phage regulator Rha-like protein
MPAVSSLSTETVMSDLILSAVQMNSLEIADLVESNHADTRRSIERLADRGVIELPPTAEVSQKVGVPGPKTVSVYVFSGEKGKRDSIIVVAQLSPEFTARLVDRWQALESGEATPVVRAKKVNHRGPTLPQEVRALLLIAKQMSRDVPGIDKALAHAVVLDAIEEATGLPARMMNRALPSVTVEEAATMNQTQLGEALGGYKARAIGIMIDNQGWRAKDAAGDWILTEAGKPYGEMKPYHRNGHSGYELRWKPAAVQALRAIQAKDAAA